MLKQMAKRFIKDESGQGMIEYVIIAALIVIAVVVILSNLGGTLGDKFKFVDKELKNAKPK